MLKQPLVPIEDQSFAEDFLPHDRASWEKPVMARRKGKTITILAAIGVLVVIALAAF